MELTTRELMIWMDTLLYPAQPQLSITKKHTNLWKRKTLWNSTIAAGTNRCTARRSSSRSRSRDWVWNRWGGSYNNLRSPAKATAVILWTSRPRMRNKLRCSTSIRRTDRRIRRCFRRDSSRTASRIRLIWNVFLPSTSKPPTTSLRPSRQTQM